jgi:hypothetical protein
VEVGAHDEEVDPGVEQDVSERPWHSGYVVLTGDLDV